MNASLRKTEDPGPEAAPPEPAAWPAEDDEPPDDTLAADGLDGPAIADGAGRSALGPAASEAQLVAWIEAIVDQDEQALAALYDATFSRVFGLVRRIVRNAAMAEEVVEDAYFQVWRQAVRFDPARGKALTWLLAMARSRAIDALRSESRFAHDSLSEDAEASIPGEVALPDELLDLARQRADLHQALLLLGEQPRQLVALAFLRGLSHEEIAQQTCLPLGTVKSHIRRALQSLRQILDNGTPTGLAS